MCEEKIEKQVQSINRFTRDTECTSNKYLYLTRHSLTLIFLSFVGLIQIKTKFKTTNDII